MPSRLLTGRSCVISRAFRRPRRRTLCRAESEWFVALLWQQRHSDLLSGSGTPGRVARLTPSSSPEKPRQVAALFRTQPGSDGCACQLPVAWTRLCAVPDTDRGGTRAGQSPTPSWRNFAKSSRADGDCGNPVRDPLFCESNSRARIQIHGAKVSSRSQAAPTTFAAATP